MVLAHNLTAMNAQRQFNIVGTAKRKSTEKLSSGYKINRAADDAAGLSISEKMRKQIRGLDRASDNCQDGVSLCQVADGALAETHEILQRINELSIQSANGTNSSSDRAAIQAEVKQLTDEIDRIATTTSFNERIFPLNRKENSALYVESNRIRTDETGEKWVLPADIKECTYEIRVVGTLNYDGISYSNGDKVCIKGISKPTEDGKIGVYYDIGGMSSESEWIKDDGLSGGYQSLSYSELKVNKDGYIFFEHKDGRGLKYYMDDSHISLDGAKAESWDGWKATPYSIQSGTNDVNYGLCVHAGSESDMTLKIPVNIVNATKKGLGLTNPELNLSTGDGATAAIDRVKNAIEIVSGYRSYFGAVQNRMEHTISNLDNVVENTQAAESRIRDTDMATEMVNNTKLNVLEQAVTSMLAQANQSTQGGLSLLQ